MPLFNRKSNNKVNTTQAPKNDGADFLKEYATSDGTNMYSFIQGIRYLDSNYINNDILIDRMTKDSVISSAIDMWTEDALQRDPQTKEIFNVEVDAPNDYIESALSNNLSKELDTFLKKDLRMEKNLIPIIKRLLIYGNCPVKLDFADKLVDDKLQLKESEKNEFQEVSNKITELIGDTSKDKSLDSTDRYYTNKRLNEAYEVDWEKYGNDIVSKDNKDLKALRESLKSYYDENCKTLTESELLDLKPMMKGRWYTEIMGHGTNIYELTAKQKLIAYMDRDNPDKFIKPDRIVNFSNNTGKHKVIFEIGDRNTEIQKRRYYQLERGESFLENSMTAWQVLSALEDILLLTRMTRSILYRIFSVEVGNKGNKETKDLLDRLRNKIKMDETVDIRSKIYNSSLTQVPLGDSIFIPTRNGTGVIDVKTVGGDVNLHDAIDLDYFKDKLFAGLRIPAPFLGFTESLPGGIGDTSLTRMDIRYSRTITRIQSILSEGLKDLCLVYLKLTRTDEAFDKLPDFKIVFTSVNSAEDMSRAELKQTQMKTLQDTLTNLSALGIDLSANAEGYAETRKQIIKDFFGSTMLDKVTRDEKSMPVQGPTEGNPNELHNNKPIDVEVQSNGPVSNGEPEENNEEPNENTNNEEPEENNTSTDNTPAPTSDETTYDIG